MKPTDPIEGVLIAQVVVASGRAVLQLADKPSRGSGRAWSRRTRKLNDAVTYLGDEYFDPDGLAAATCNGCS